MKDLLDRVNNEKPVMGPFSCADDFTRVADEERADQLWNERGEALAEVGLGIDQSRGVLIDPDVSERHGHHSH